MTALREWGRVAATREGLGTRSVVVGAQPEGLDKGNPLGYPAVADYRRGDGMPNNAAAARRRRLKRSRCGNCGAAAARMRPWGAVTIPICGACEDRLTGTATPDVSDTEQQPPK